MYKNCSFLKTPIARLPALLGIIPPWQIGSHRNCCHRRWQGRLAGRVSGMAEVVLVVVVVVVAADEDENDEDPHDG